MTPLDLTKHAPRSPYVKLGGLLMLARTIDKLRAELPGGDVGAFHYSVMSEELFSDLGIAHDDLLDVVAHANNDDEVIAWVHANSDRSRYEACNNKMIDRKIAPESRERLEKKYPVLMQHPDLESVLDLLDLDDAACFAQH